MDFLPDILDHLGKTPRELGALHLYVETLLRADDGSSCAVLWVQAAVTPIEPGGTIRVLETTVAIPPLDDGRVMQAKLPLQIPAGTSELGFAVSCVAAARAERVRPAWKLFDTFQIPTLSEMRPSNDDPGAGVGGLLLANALTLPLGVAVIPTGFGGGSVSGNSRTTVHKARTLPPHFVASVEAGRPEAVHALQWTEIWRPGQPLPAAPSVTPLPLAAPPPAARAQGGRRECSHCRFSGKREDFAGDRYCPECGHEWD